VTVEDTTDAEGVRCTSPFLCQARHDVRTRIAFNATSVAPNDFVAFVLPEGPQRSGDASCAGAKRAMDAQLFQPSQGALFGLDSVQVGRDMAIVVRFRTVGQHEVCVASTGGLSPLGDSEFRLTLARVLVVPTVLKSPPPPPPSPSVPPTSPLSPPQGQPAPAPNVTRHPIEPPPPESSAGSELPRAQSGLSVEDLMLVVGTAFVLLILVLLTISMVRAKLLAQPVGQMLPMALGSVDFVTDVSFVMLCYENRARLEARGLSLIPPLAAVFVALPVSLSVASSFVIMRKAKQRHRLKQWLLKEHSGLYAGVGLISIINLEALKLMPWRQENYGGGPSVQFLYATMLVQLTEDLPQLLLQLMYISTREIGPFCLFQGSSAEGDCNSDAIAVVSCLFSTVSIVWQLLRKGLILTFTRPQLHWCGYDEEQMGTADARTGSIASKSDDSPLGKTRLASIGSFSHSSGCHSWQVGIGRVDGWQVGAPIRIGVCNAADFDPVKGSGSRAWGVDPDTRLVYVTSDAFHTGHRAPVQPFYVREDVNVGCSSVGIFIDVSRQKLWIQFDGGAFIDSGLELAGVETFCAWCIVGPTPLTIDNYSRLTVASDPNVTAPRQKVLVKTLPHAAYSFPRAFGVRSGVVVAQRRHGGAKECRPPQALHASSDVSFHETCGEASRRASLSRKSSLDIGQLVSTGELGVADRAEAQEEVHSIADVYASPSGQQSSSTAKEIVYPSGGERKRSSVRRTSGLTDVTQPKTRGCAQSPAHGCVRGPARPVALQWLESAMAEEEAIDEDDDAEASLERSPAFGRRAYSPQAVVAKAALAASMRPQHAAESSMEPSSAAVRKSVSSLTLAPSPPVLAGVAIPVVHEESPLEQPSATPTRNTAALERAKARQQAKGERQLLPARACSLAEGHKAPADFLQQELRASLQEGESTAPAEGDGDGHSVKARSNKPSQRRSGASGYFERGRQSLDVNAAEQVAHPRASAQTLSLAPDSHGTFEAPPLAAPLDDIGPAKVMGASPGEMSVALAACRDRGLEERQVTAALEQELEAERSARRAIELQHREMELQNMSLRMAISKVAELSESSDENGASDDGEERPRDDASGAERAWGSGGQLDVDTYANEHARKSSAEVDDGTASMSSELTHSTFTSMGDQEHVAAQYGVALRRHLQPLLDERRV